MSLVPTIVAPGAADTARLVYITTRDRRYSSKFFDDANFWCWSNCALFLQAPDDYLLAGIGDALAKWYEAVVLRRSPETLPLTVRLALTARALFAILPTLSSEQALADVKQQRRPTRILRRGGCDYRWRRRYGGGLNAIPAAAAHAVRRLTVLPRKTRKWLCGILGALPSDDVLAYFLDTAYRRFHLPTRLSELTISS